MKHLSRYCENATCGLDQHKGLRLGRTAAAPTWPTGAMNAVASPSLPSILLSPDLPHDASVLIGPLQQHAVEVGAQQLQQVAHKGQRTAPGTGDEVHVGVQPPAEGAGQEATRSEVERGCTKCCSIMYQ